MNGKDQSRSECISAIEDRQGREPYDVIGIYWDANDYERQPGTEYTGAYSYVGKYRGDYDTTGLAVEYEGKSHYMEKQRNNNYCYTGDISTSFGTQVKRHDPSQPPSQRNMQCDFDHTYQNCGISSISVSNTGVSISGSCTTDSWDAQKELAEDNVNFIC